MYSLPPSPRGRIGRLLPFGGGYPATGFPRSPEDSRPRRFVSADIFILSEQIYLSSAIDFSSVGKQVAEPETQNCRKSEQSPIFREVFRNLASRLAWKKFEFFEAFM